MSAGMVRKREWQMKALECLKRVGKDTPMPLADIVDMAALSRRITLGKLDPEQYVEDRLLQSIAAFLVQHEAFHKEYGPLDREWQGELAKHKTACREAMGEVYVGSIERPDRGAMGDEEYLAEMSLALTRRKEFAVQCLVPSGLLKGYHEEMSFVRLMNATQTYGQNLAADMMQSIERGEYKAGVGR